MSLAASVWSRSRQNLRVGLLLLTSNKHSYPLPLIVQQLLRLALVMSYQSREGAPVTFGLVLVVASPLFSVLPPLTLVVAGHGFHPHLLCRMLSFRLYTLLVALGDEAL